MITAYESHISRLRVPMGKSYLTRREHELVQMYLDGLRREEIAAAKRVSVKTIDTLLDRAKRRLGIRTNYQLIAMVATANAIEEPGRSTNAQQPPDRSKVARGAPSRAL